MTTMFPSPGDLPDLVNELVATFDALPPHPFLRAAWLFQAIGAVHPFIDANGGTARFLASVELTRVSLPPFVLTDLERRTSYVDAIVAGDDELNPLLQIVHDVVQRELANVLAKEPPLAEWTPRERELATAWTALADTAWRVAAGIHLERSDDPMGLDSFVRRGYRVPLRPIPQVARWSSNVPVPFQFQLAVLPARAGDATWTLASVVASVGDNDLLAPILVGEPIAAVFVTAPTESIEVASTRFERWLAKRIDQSVRGLAAWM